MMKDVYRGHEIVVVDGTPKSAVILEPATGTELPTKITALPDESDGACLRRARHLLDIYLDALAEGPDGRSITSEALFGFDGG
jgi:hypothetical protein